MAQRLPTVGGDSGNWGTVLNDYLGVSLNSDGTINSNTVADAQVASGAAINPTKINGTAEVQTNKNQPSGYAPLDSNSLLPTANLPTTIPIANIPTGATSSTVAIGNDSRITGAVQSSQLPSWITLPNNWYSGAWFTAKSVLGSTKAWILFDGDSITGGNNPAGAGFLATSFTSKLRATLLTNTGAVVYGDHYPIFTYSQTSGGADPVNEGFPAPSNIATAEGPFGSSFNASVNNAWCQTITTGAIPGWTTGLVTGFDLVFYDYAAGTWGFTIDGGQGTGAPVVTGATWQTSPTSYYQITCTGGGTNGGTVKKVSVTGLTAGSHTIQWGYQSTTTVFFIHGISLYTGNSVGLGFVRNCYGGRRAIDAATSYGHFSGLQQSANSFPADKIALWSGSGTSQGATQITPTPFGFPTQPSLAVLSWGINDCAIGISPDMFSEAIQRRIIALRRGVTNCNIVLLAVANPDPNNSDNNLTAFRGAYWHRYKRVLANLAAAYQCSFVDIDTKWCGNPVSQGFMSSGSPHPTANGYIDIANVLAEVL